MEFTVRTAERNIPPAERRRRLAQVYRLLTERARGEGIVRYGGVIPTDGEGSLRGVALVSVGDKQGIIGVWDNRNG